jgi:hypothetical protein
VVWLLIAALGAQSPDVPSNPPVSLERVREGLARPATLAVTLPEPAVHYRVEVRSYYKILELPPLWQLHPGEKIYTPSVVQIPGMPGSTPLFQIDMMSIGQTIGRAISSARRARAERDANREVEEAMRQFCATNRCDSQ